MVFWSSIGSQSLCHTEIHSYWSHGPSGNTTTPACSMPWWGEDWATLCSPRVVLLSVVYAIFSGAGLFFRICKKKFALGALCNQTFLYSLIYWHLALLCVLKKHYRKMTFHDTFSLGIMDNRPVRLSLFRTIFQLWNRQRCFSLTTFQHKHQHKPNFSISE